MSRNSTAVLAAFVVAMWIAPSRAFAQQEPRPAAFGQLRLGSLFLTPSIGLSDIGVDTNVFNTDEDVRSDFTLTVSPQVEAFYGTDRLRLRATTGAGFVYYYRYKSERAINPGTRFEGQFRLGRRITVFTDDRFWFHKDRPNHEVETRSRRLETDLLFGVRVGLGPRIDMEASGRHARAQYGNARFLDVPLEQTLDRTSRSVAVSAGYRLTPYTSVMTGVSLVEERFPNVTDRDGTSRNIWAGLRFGERAKVAGDARVGYTDFDALSPSTRDYHGVTTDVRLNSALFDMTSVTIAARHDLQFSYTVDYPYFLNQFYDLSVSQRLSRRFDVALTTQQYLSDYRAPAITSDATLDDRRDWLRYYSISPGMVVRGGLRFGVYGSYSNRRAPLGVGRSHEGFRWGVVVTTRGVVNVNDRGVFINGQGR